MFIPPFQGFVFFVTLNPGRCPGLDYGGLSGLKILASRKYWALRKRCALEQFGLKKS
jgi:hypothetical protein